MVDTPTENINIQLGDIIEIVAPENPKLNLQQFYIDFINQEKLIILNIETTESTELDIINGEFADTSIQQIDLLSRADSPSYAKQHNLLPGVWIEILFKTEDELVIKGLITNLEEDMIEVKTYPNDDTIYIDFAYQGLPPDLEIDKIEIIKNPTILEDDAPEISEEPEQPIKSDEAEPFSEVKIDSILQESGIDPDDASPEIIETQILQALTDGNQIELGEDLEDITIFVDVPESERRYSIEQQTDDLLDELLANIPSEKRTNRLLNEIHLTIERYVQLRSQYSILDQNGNHTMPPPILDTDKPIVDVLSNFKKNVGWIIPVSKNANNLYEVEKTLASELNSINNLNLGTVLAEEKSYEDQFKTGQIRSDDNDYKEYMNYNNPLYTPFQNPIDIENSIISDNVNADILSIVNNIDDNETFVVDKPDKDGSNVTRKKYFFEIYTRGFKYLNENLVSGDTINITSVILLTLPFLIFSKKDLPSTNILERSLLNENFLYYWKSITKNTSISQTNTIDSINSESESGYESGDDAFEIMKTDIFKNFQQYMLDETLYSNPTNNNTYKKFLSQVIPTNIQCLSIIKSISKSLVSIYSLVKEFEPFYIYRDNITSQLYDSINNFLESNIAQYKSRLVDNISKYKSFISKKFIGAPVSEWFSVLEKHASINTIIMEAYDINNTYTNSELFNKVYSLDYGELLTIALVRIDLDLQTNKLLEEFVEKYQESLKAKASEDAKCKVITNRYYSKESLLADNGKEIFVDQEFDKTDYKYIEKFKDMQSSTSPEEFKEFLKNKLVENKQLDIEEAEREATTLINKKLLVKNGDYAILNQDDTTEYYIRNSNEWTLDESLKLENIEIKDNKLFCNLQEDCISDSKTCDTVTERENSLSDDVLKQIHIEFDKTYDERSKKVRVEIDKLLEASIMRIKLLKKYKFNEFYKYDTAKRDLANSLDEEPELTQSSPYEKLRDTILGIEDFVKRQNYIQKFVNIFTRPAFSNEDPNWLYCKKTSSKILPLFLSKLANIFISGGDYVYELDLIATNQGTISDDGDTFVDKHSGYFIKKIEFDTEEGYTEEGFKMKTREKMEQDLGDHILELATGEKQTGKVLTGDAKLVANIIYAITGPGGMAIDISNQREFIIDNVLQLHKQLAPSKQQYEKMSMKSQKEGKKIQSFEDQVGRPLIILTFIYILIAIQINIPIIETTKTFPNCVRGFDGYPFFGDELNAITYIACIARKMKNEMYPWSSIFSLKEDKIIAQMKAIIDNKRYKILSSPSVRLKIDEKRRYLKNKRKDIKADLIVDSKLPGFLPPVVKYTVKVYPLVEGFTTMLARNVKSGSYMQHEQINVIKSKIIKFGLYIQESIKKVIEKQTPLITSKSGIIFLQNACCDSLSTNVHKYFAELDTTLTQNNNIVTGLSDILHDIYTSSSAPILYDPRDSKYYYPELSKTFSTNTIYQAFIVFCKNKELNLNDELLEACGLTEIDEGNDIETKIEKMKEDSINYSDELFQQLLTLVNTKNKVQTNITYSYPNKIQEFTDVLDELKSSPDDIIAPEVVNELSELLDRYSLKEDSESSANRKLKNYLDTTNTSLIQKINLFIKANTQLSKSKLATLMTCIEDINKFLEVSNDIISNEDETTFRTINFIKIVINKLVTLYPNIILNKINYQDTKIPAHWNLSMRHVSDIKDIINNYYKNLKPLYDLPDLIDILQKIPDKLSNILKLAKTTPYFAEIYLTEATQSSIFDSRLLLLLYKYYFLKTIECYIDLSEEVTFDVSKKEEAVELPVEEEEEKIERPEEQPIKEPIKEITSQTYLAQATIAGSKLEKMQITAKYITTVMDVICLYKRDVNYNKDSIMDKILSSKEKEKQGVTDYLKNLTDEEREVENIFKNQKLEKWSKGLQKGLTQYVQDTYDEERESAEQEMIKDKKLAKQTGINDYNRNIYAYEFDMEQEITDEIEREEYSLEDYPGEDGDEPEYDNFEQQDEF